MGTWKFSMHMMKKEYKKSLVYTLTLCLTIAVTFLFFNIIDNQHLLSQDDAVAWSTQGVDIPFSSLLAFLVIIFCAFMIIFANNFYLSRKTKEIAIMTMSGSNFMSITLYLFYQNLVMTMIAFPIGILIGSFAAMGVNQCIYSYLSYSGPFFYIPLNAISDTIVCVVAIIGAQLIYASGFVYRKDIQYMLSQETSNVSADKRIFKLPKLFYVCIYILGIVMLLGIEYTSTSAIVPCCIGVLGIGGMINYCFPSLFRFIKEKRILANKKRLISLSNLYYSLHRAVVLVGLYGVASTVMIAIMISQQDSPRELITAIIGFIVIVLLLLASILYKYSMETSTRKMFYYNLYKLGYSFQQLIHIIKQEVFSFYSLLIGLPLVYILIALIQAFIHEGITIEFFVTVILTQLISAIIAGVLTYTSYKKSVLQVIEEGVHYE